MLILAHAGEPLAPHDLWSAWSFDPVVIAAVAVTWWLYGRGIRSAGHRAVTRRSRLTWGLVVAAIAVLSPIDAMGSVLASAHMVQHLLLMMVAAPVLAWAHPGEALLLGFPRGFRKRLGGWRRRLRLTPAITRRISHPGLVWLLFAAGLWFWHLPGPYQAAVDNELVHAMEHSTFIAVALFFWATIINTPARMQGLAVLGVFAAALQGTVLAAILTFARSPLYSSYEATAPIWGLTPLEDQQLAGVIMWVPGGLIYLVVGLALFASWIAASAGEPLVAPGE